MRILTAAALARRPRARRLQHVRSARQVPGLGPARLGKKPLPGERRAVFPEGVPGVPQGVPREMVKGYQPPPEAPPPVIEAKQPRSGQKAEEDRRRPAPRAAAAAGEEQQEPPMQQAPAARTPAGATGRRRLADHAGRAADLADRRAARAAALIPTAILAIEVRISFALRSDARNVLCGFVRHRDNELIPL